MKKSSSKIEAPPPAEEGAYAWSWQARAAASVLIALHVLAVFLSPCAGPPPASDLERGAASWFDPYLQATYLNHGYRFFAPNPGPGQLVRVELEMPDGSTRSEQFPDPEVHAPRLHYHRYLILAAYLSDVSTASAPGDPASDAERSQRIEQLRRQGHLDEADWISADAAGERKGREQAEARKQAILDAWGAELLKSRAAKRVKFYAIEHEIPPPWEIRAGMPLSEKALYREKLVGERSAEQGGQP